MTFEAIEHKPVLMLPQQLDSSFFRACPHLGVTHSGLCAGSWAKKVQLH